MTAHVELLENGATRYETDSLKEFHEAIAGAHAAGAKIDLKTGEGNGTHVAWIFYKDEAPLLPGEVDGDVEVIGHDDEEVEQESPAEQEGEEVEQESPAEKPAPAKGKKG